MPEIAKYETYYVYTGIDDREKQSKFRWITDWQLGCQGSIEEREEKGNEYAAGNRAVFEPAKACCDNGDEQQNACYQNMAVSPEGEAYGKSQQKQAEQQRYGALSVSPPHQKSTGETEKGKSQKQDAVDVPSLPEAVNADRKKEERRQKAADGLGLE